MQYRLLGGRISHERNSWCIEFKANEVGVCIRGNCTVYDAMCPCMVW